MNILVLGNGAREHALCFSIAKSDQLSKLFCAPGNYGISKIAEVHNFDINNFDTLYDFCFLLMELWIFLTAKRSWHLVLKRFQQVLRVQKYL